MHDHAAAKHMTLYVYLRTILTVGLTTSFKWSNVHCLYKPTESQVLQLLRTGGGALVFEFGYHPRKEIHVIRVAFQDKAMYARTSFRGAKTCKIGKKGCAFSHIDKFLKENGQIKKKSLKYKCPPQYKCPPPQQNTLGHSIWNPHTLWKNYHKPSTGGVSIPSGIAH